MGTSSVVHAFVLDASAGVAVGCLAVATLKQSIPRMQFLVAPQKRSSVELLGALVTGKALYAGVSEEVQLEVAGAGEVPATLLAYAIPLASLPL